MTYLKVLGTGVSVRVARLVLYEWRWAAGGTVVNAEAGVDDVRAERGTDEPVNSSC